MSSPGLITRSEDSFEDLLSQLRESHRTALQEFEAKVAKLKKERCLDAQRLEVFFNRNQKLKEQNKCLLDTISGFEERLHAGVCEKCLILEDLKNSQGQNFDLLNTLKQDYKALQDENQRLHAEVETLKRACSDRLRASSPDVDDCVIPDSPVMSSSLPTANKLKKRKNAEKSKFVRSLERPRPPAHSSLFIEDEKAEDKLENPVKVLVPNTCELDASQIDVELNPENIIAETCCLDLPPCIKKKKTVRQRRTPETSFSSAAVPSLSHSPTTERSPSLLSHNKRLSNDRFITMVKWKKDESQLEAKEENQDNSKEAERKGSQTMHPKLQQSTLLNKRRFKGGGKSQSKQEEMLSDRPNLSSSSPVFKKPNATVKQLTQKIISDNNRTPLKNRNESPCQLKGDMSQREFQVEPMWSIDPALAFEMSDSEQGIDEEKDEKHCPGESLDTDCTWVSHSLLQGRTENCKDKREVSGLGDKANDSLERLFETSACEDFKSYNTLHMDQDHPGDQDEDEDDEDENGLNRRKPGQPTFAHVAVIRKKDERRKLKGATCKECEIYYAHLPEEERQKKLSNCSRHRFLYIPPCTPENFWEVGFPSTQTCVERGYIKEDQNPQTRSRRRQPLNALFSPKSKKEEN